MATVAPKTYQAPSDPLVFFRGLALALPLGLMLWVALFCAAWRLCRG
jgi:hypothetical protein